MAADALAPGVARPSATLVLIMQNKQVLASHEEGFQLPKLSQCWEIIENATTFLKNQLTHWGLVTPYGDRDLGQHWLR